MNSSHHRRANLIKVLIFCVVAIILMVIGGAVYVYTQKNSSKFLGKTVINGTEMSRMTPESAAEYMIERYRTIPVKLIEYDETSIEGTFEDFGYSMKEEELLKVLRGLQEKQNDTVSHLLTSMFFGNSYTIEIPMEFHREQLEAYVNAAAMKEPRTETKDALLLMAEDMSYYITPEVYGNNFADEDLQNYVKTVLDEFLETQDLTNLEECRIPFPEAIYAQPTVGAEDPALIATCNAYNQFSKARIVYQFGSQTEVLDWGTIVQWVGVDTENASGYLLEEPMRAYVSDLANRYNTRFWPRTFHTSFGSDVGFEGSQNEYGYTIDEEAEFNQLHFDVQLNEEVTREPVYISTNDYGNPVYYHREGRDDLAGTYVEVCISAQHLWFYKNGQLLVDTPIVSGSVANNTQTQTGVFPLAYKESPSTLTGSNAENGYSTEVSYWMPFYEGQGLHDATWRGAFGGQIYQTSGSHGCVNLPYSAAEQIYNNIDAGTAIIIYN